MALFDLQKLETPLDTGDRPKHKIMLVDDDATNLMVLEALLKKEHEVILAKDGAEAFDKICKMEQPEDIAVIISDQRMPHMTGSELFEKILPLMPHTMRVILTGYSDVQEILDCMNRTQIYRYMCKPVDRQDLMITVRRAVDVFDMQRRLDDYHRHLEYQALHDPLTNLPNSRSLEQDLNKLFQTTPEQMLFGICLLKLDRIRAVIAGQGHAFGDRLLVAAAESLLQTVKLAKTELPNARLYRFDGATFALLIPGVQSSVQLENFVDALVCAMHQPLQVNDLEFFLNLKIGLSIYPLDGLDADELMKNTDAAFFQAKQQVGSSVIYYSPEMNILAQKQLTMEQELRHAVTRNQLCLHFQPQIAIRTGKVVGLEALVRWQHPDNGMVSPGEFIPLSESTGLIVPIGEWVLKEACEQNKRWLKQGLRMVVAVNISARQFQHPKFLEMVLGILNETGLPPEHLELEITESVLVGDVQQSVRILQVLRNHGVHLSIDDFGTGYSSLNYLKSFPLNNLKVDQSFVRSMPTSPQDAAIAQTIISLGHKMDMQVIAEGVETQTHLDQLASYSCDVIQGFMFARPMPVEQLDKWMQQWDERPLLP